MPSYRSCSTVPPYSPWNDDILAENQINYYFIKSRRSVSMSYSVQINVFLILTHGGLQTLDLFLKFKTISWIAAAGVVLQDISR